MSNKHQTPAEKRGFKIGGVYEAVKPSKDVPTGNLYRFVEDDHTSWPWFVKLNDGLNPEPEKIAIHLSDLRPTQVNPDGVREAFHLDMRTILLEYVKQHYPNDKVLTLLVEAQ